MRQVLADPDAAPIAPGLRATLAFLRKMTREPAALGADDARAVLAAGVSRRALLDAIHVAYLFNVYDRLADTMGWDVPADDAAYDEAAVELLGMRGYRI